MYAQPTDLTNIGVPATALVSLTPAQISANLQSASDFADTFFRARWGTNAVPLVAWDTAVTEAVAKIAAFRLLTVRGYKSQGNDDVFRQGYKDAVDWLDRVQRQQAHPNVTLAAANLPGSVQPNVLSSSVVNLANGRSAPNRGW